jgi:hypothetical protein
MSYFALGCNLEDMQKSQNNFAIVKSSQGKQEP